MVTKGFDARFGAGIDYPLRRNRSFRAGAACSGDVHVTAGMSFRFLKNEARGSGRTRGGAAGRAAAADSSPQRRREEEGREQTPQRPRRKAKIDTQGNEDKNRKGYSFAVFPPR